MPLFHRTNFARQARTVADAVRALEPEIRSDDKLTDMTLSELDRVAKFFERDARLVDTFFNSAKVPRKALAHNAHEIMFVNRMCEVLWQPNGRRPYTLVSVLANVAFDVSAERLWCADRVKHCYRSRSPKAKVGNIKSILKR
jgi:hypothetical protein